jgi:uncharacterized membrane protein
LFMFYIYIIWRSIKSLMTRLLVPEVRKLFCVLIFIEFVNYRSYFFLHSIFCIFFSFLMKWRRKSHFTEKINHNLEFSSFVKLYLQATRQQSLNYGCIVENKDTHEVRHLWCIPIFRQVLGNLCTIIYF